MGGQTGDMSWADSREIRSGVQHLFMERGMENNPYLRKGGRSKAFSGWNLSLPPARRRCERKARKEPMFDRYLSKKRESGLN